jgi:hypothetical protein
LPGMPFHRPLVASSGKRTEKSMPPRTSAPAN